MAIDLPGNSRTIPSGHDPADQAKGAELRLQCARGDFVVVYDAEDRSLPSCGRRWTFFAAAGDLVSVQAQLNIDNPYRSWLTRQFTIEYPCWDAILPALERLRLPVPLGGTSNHFPRATLSAAAPGTVQRYGRCRSRHPPGAAEPAHLCACTTWEEAPVDLATWLKQRTRWLKGWMLLSRILDFPLHGKALHMASPEIPSTVATLSQRP